MQAPVSAKVTRERWRPPPESSFTVNFPSALSGATPEKAHRNAAERSWWCSLCDTTPAPHTVHCHGLPSRIRKPSTCHLVKFEHSPLPTAFAFAGGQRAEGVSAELRKQASK